MLEEGWLDPFHAGPRTRVEESAEEGTEGGELQPQDPTPNLGGEKAA